MGTSKVIHALYTDDDVLMAAVKAVKAQKYHIEEVYTPFPVHGLDKAMGLAPTKIACNVRHPTYEDGVVT